MRRVISSIAAPARRAPARHAIACRPRWAIWLPIRGRCWRLRRAALLFVRRCFRPFGRHPFGGFWMPGRMPLLAGILLGDDVPGDRDASCASMRAGAAQWRNSDTSVRCGRRRPIRSACDRPRVCLRRRRRRPHELSGRADGGGRRSRPSPLLVRWCSTAPSVSAPSGRS